MYLIRLSFSKMSCTLHIFNPWHDEALSANSPYYYPSTIARQLEKDWYMLPSFWAANGDAVYCPDESFLKSRGAEVCVHGKQLQLVGGKNIGSGFWKTISCIAPWGWDALLKHRLLKMGAPEMLLPTDNQLQITRSLSSRETTTAVLPQIKEMLSCQQYLPLVGQSFVAHNMEEVTNLVSNYKNVMIKSLWSCSGRGVFRLGENPNQSDEGRVRKLLRLHQGVEVEPLYDSVLDFALEFDALLMGEVKYRGLSLFRTTEGGGYVANVVQPQEVLQEHVFTVCPLLRNVFTLLCKVCEEVLASVICKRYVGALGIDMMLVRQLDGTMALHPCIEVNLRKTMGYVACMLAEQQIECWEGKYPFCKTF